MNDAIRAETAADMRGNGAECANLFHHMARSAPPRVTHHVKSVIVLIIKRRFKTSKGQGQGSDVKRRFKTSKGQGQGSKAPSLCPLQR